MCAQSSKQSVTIKKYANRRLYNTATSSYVTLQDLSVMVKDGTEFNVYDAKTSEDITRSVLTQIIVEEENKADQPNLLPINFLRQLIGYYGDNLQWMVPKYLEHSMDMLSGHQSQIKDYFQSSLGNVFPFGTTLEEMSKQNMSMFENTLRMFSPLAGLDMLTGSFGTSTTSTDNNTTSSTSNAPTATTSSNASNCCATDKKSCCTTNKTTESSTKADKPDNNASTATTTASVTNLKPRNNNNNETNTAATVTTTTTPMPNVQSATSNNSGTDDMQQKIANLQRQLADLAKSRA